MFEDSLVESRVYHVSSSKRWTMLLSMGLQAAIAGVGAYNIQYLFYGILRYAVNRYLQGKALYGFVAQFAQQLHLRYPQFAAAVVPKRFYYLGLNMQKGTLC